MVDSVNNGHSGLVIAGGTLIGGVAGGYYGYNSKPYMKGSEVRDTFVKSVQENLVNNATKKVDERVANALKEIEAFKDTDAVKAFLIKDMKENHADYNIKGNKVSYELRAKDFIGDKKVEDLKTELKEKMEGIKNEFHKEENIKALKEGKFSEAKVGKDIKASLKDGKLLEQKEVKFVAKDTYATIAKAISHAKVKAAAIYGAAAGTLFALGGLVTKALTSKPNKEEA